jgi:hypothetical protein
MNDYACNYNGDADVNNVTCLYPCITPGGCNAAFDDRYDCDGKCIADGGYDCTYNPDDYTTWDGACGGSAEYQTYWWDSDGDGLGGGTAYSLCNATVTPTGPGGYVQVYDPDEACYSNQYDCAGTCCGTLSDDGGLTTYEVSCLVLDECGVCGGSGPPTNYNCDMTCNVDLDCFGICNGDTVFDSCGVCGGSGPPENFNCDGTCAVDEDCFGICNGSYELDECGVCGGPDSLQNYDCDGNCNVGTDCFGICNGTAVVDTCGICDGDGTTCDEGCMDDGTNPDYPNRPDYVPNGYVQVLFSTSTVGL